MTTNAHTPTPWAADVDLPYAKKPRVYSADGHLVAEVGNSQIERQDQWDADAAFIVRAVNAHEELVEALRQVAAWKGAVSMIAPELGGLLTAMYATEAVLAKLEA